MPSNSMTAPLLPGSSGAVFRAYPSRWYIAAVFVVFCIMQSAMWSFYSPISGSLTQLYGWGPYFIEWLGNTANIVFCILVVPLGVWVDGRGMRAPIILTIVALCVNSGLRCLPRASVGEGAYSSISMASMVFNGIAGTVETLSPPVLSALWFPAHERGTATALMATANTLGTCVGFLTAFVVPPALANDCSYSPSPSNCSSADPPPPPPDALAASNAQINSAVTTVYYTYFAVCAATLVCVLFYFPSRPPSPPAASSALARDVSLLAGLRALARNAKFWAAVFCMSVPLGVCASAPLFLCRCVVCVCVCL
jgi:MFS transporter, FLVCR family, disrupted in renal carcinoma protein 2